MEENNQEELKRENNNTTSAQSDEKENFFDTETEVHYTAEMVSKMNLHELIDGTYKGGESKTYASFISGEIDIETKDIGVMDERGLPLVVANHTRAGNFVQLDLTFKKDAQQDLRYTYESLARFTKKMQELNDEKKAIPFITFTVIPQQLQAQIAFTFSAPVFFALSSDNARNRPNSISMLFEAKNVSIEETGLTKADIIQLNTEIVNSLEAERRRQEEREKAYEEDGE